MGLLGFGQKRKDYIPAVETNSLKVGSEKSSTKLSLEITVYGTRDATRCRNVRAVLDNHGYEFRDVLVDEDTGTRAWLQRTTGDDALPKVFIGNKCYGGFEDIQTLAFDGTLDRILSGEALISDEKKELERLKQEMSVASILKLLKAGAILTLNENGSEIDTWAEPHGKPPQIFYEGVPYPIDDIESIAQQIVDRIAAEEIVAMWKEDD